MLSFAHCYSKLTVGRYLRRPAFYKWSSGYFEDSKNNGFVSDNFSHVTPINSYYNSVDLLNEAVRTLN
jgi:hypothetical protein